MRATLRTTRSARPRPRPGSPGRFCSSRRRSRPTPAAATPPARPWRPATPRRAAGSGCLHHQPYRHFLTRWPPWPAMTAKLARPVRVTAAEGDGAVEHRGPGRGLDGRAERAALARFGRGRREDEEIHRALGAGLVDAVRLA